jgi:hypothetical protein
VIAGATVDRSRQAKSQQTVQQTGAQKGGQAGRHAARIVAETKKQPEGCFFVLV